jgi:hypothetical protein
MSKRKPFIALLLLTTALTDSGGPPAARVARAEPSQSSPAAVEVEIRDFRLERSEETYGTDFKGRGTVLTKDPSLQDSNIMLVLKEHKVPNTDSSGDFFRTIYLERGVGTIETSDWVKKEVNNPRLPQYSWTLVGWIELKNASLSVQEQ